MLLEEIVAAGADGEKTAKAIVSRYLTSKRSIPGFGNRQHKPDDPRTPRILAVAEEENLAGRYVAALKLLGREVDRGYQKHITINATGAIAAVLLEINIPASIMRGLAVISRAAGLLAHLREEQELTSGDKSYSMLRTVLCPMRRPSKKRNHANEHPERRACPGSFELRERALCVPIAS